MYLKKSYEIVNSLKISLNNIIISSEVNIDRSSLVNYILNNAKDSYTDYRNLEINDSSSEDLTIKYNPFISKETYDYLNDSDFLSLFFELSAGYEAIMVIICRKYELLK